MGVLDLKRKLKNKSAGIIRVEIFARKIRTKETRVLRMMTALFERISFFASLVLRQDESIPIAGKNKQDSTKKFALMLPWA